MSMNLIFQHWRIAIGESLKIKGHGCVCANGWTMGMCSRYRGHRGSMDLQKFESFVGVRGGYAVMYAFNMHTIDVICIWTGNGHESSFVTHDP